MADEYANIAEGDPVWLEIFATDVQRARSFYSAVFNWEFTDSAKFSPDEIAPFTFGGKAHGLFGGNITKANESERKRAAKSVKMYFFAKDLKAKMETIVANGGKQVGDIEAEGEHGFIIRFEDSEGNLMGLYAAKS